MPRRGKGETGGGEGTSTQGAGWAMRAGLTFHFADTLLARWALVRFVAVSGLSPYSLRMLAVNVLYSPSVPLTT